MSNENLNPNASLDDLLDGTLDDLNDMPTFAPFIRGVHTVKLGWAIIKINEIDTVQANLALVETQEQVNPDDKPMEKGATTNVSYMLKKKDADGKLVRNDLSEGQWKAILASLREGLNLPPETSNRAVMAASEGLEVLAVTGIRTDKRDKDNIKHYTSLESVTVI